MNIAFRNVWRRCFSVDPGGPLYSVKVHSPLLISSHEFVEPRHLGVVGLEREGQVDTPIFVELRQLGMDQSSAFFLLADCCQSSNNSILGYPKGVL